MLRAWFDGACEPRNPGGYTTWGVLVGVDGGGTELYGYVGHGSEMSNNVGEYAGAIAAMDWFLFHGLEGQEIRIIGDSLMVVRQMNGELGVRRVKMGKKAPLYLPYYRKALDLRKRFKNLKFEWIPRELNVRADELSHRWVQENDLGSAGHDDEATYIGRQVAI